MFQPAQRVQVDLSGLTVQGVTFSQNVKKAMGTIVRQVSHDPPVYEVELLFSFRRIKRVEVGEDRLHPA
jgi:signal-transduction protein with cAMP-binding, CBS, and nucleotidyltransferase domain